MAKTATKKFNYQLEPWCIILSDIVDSIKKGEMIMERTLQEVQKELLEKDDATCMALEYLERAEAVLSALRKNLFTYEECTEEALFDYRTWYEESRTLLNVVKANIDQARKEIE